eukprot:m.382213 g.382213  ORF g.382213 m.382213 type:complete len:97 (+) comp20970_c1_seq39:2305-2595(+)
MSAKTPPVGTLRLHERTCTGMHAPTRNTRSQNTQHATRAHGHGWLTWTRACLVPSTATSQTDAYTTHFTDILTDPYTCNRRCQEVHGYGGTVFYYK